VLTAAHCTYEKQSGNRTFAPVEMTAARFMFTGFSRFFRRRGWRFPNASFGTLTTDKTKDNDIALLDTHVRNLKEKKAGSVKLLAANDTGSRRRRQDMRTLYYWLGGDRK